MKVCNPRGLSVLAYANGFTLWHYRAPKGHLSYDTINSQYFNSQHDMLRSGDMIYVTIEGVVDTYTKAVCVTKVDKDARVVTTSAVNW